MHIFANKNNKMIDPLEDIDISETLQSVQPLESVSPVIQWYEKFLCNNQADYIVAVESSLYDSFEEETQRAIDYMRAFTKQYADVFFPGHGDIEEHWHLRPKLSKECIEESGSKVYNKPPGKVNGKIDGTEHGTIYNYMSMHSFNLKFWAPNQQSFSQFIRGVYELSDALRTTSRLPKTAKAVHVYSKEEVRKFYEEGRADNECFWIILPHDFTFKNPDAEPYIYPDGIISMTSATTEQFWKAVQYKSLEFDVYKLFPHLTPDERMKETGHAFVEYILHHRDRYQNIIIKNQNKYG